MNLTQLLYQDYTKLTSQNLNTYRNQWSHQIGHTPKNSDILAAYENLLATKKIAQNHTLQQMLQTRKTRSLSGVAPFAVMTKPFNCPGMCTFCPLELNMPKSYLSDEPAGQRAQAVDFDPYLQVKSRLDQLKVNGHHTDKIELIVIGGTFSAYPDNYKREFFLGMYNAINGIRLETIEAAQVYNETAAHRIVGISIETRPDWIDEKEIKLLRFLGVTKLQIGVQALDGKILKRVKRGHSIRPIAKATQMLKNAGLKVCYHYMPNLPGSNPKKDVQMAQMMYGDKRFKPDFVKIYPTQVIPNTELFRQWQRGEFQTYDDNTLKQVLRDIKLVTPHFCRIDRLVRDISKKWIADGTYVTNMRQLITAEFKQEGKRCQCIRCREIKHKTFTAKPDLTIEKIDTVGGLEYFLTFEHGYDLYALLRLRLPNKRQKMIFPELKNAAIIREIHTFGRVVPLEQKQTKRSQHQGLGKKLMSEAEKLARKNGYQKIAVISSIGTRNYYRKIGYNLDGLYMVKSLKNDN